jgi:hypothetical protein
MHNKRTAVAVFFSGRIYHPNYETKVSKIKSLFAEYNTTFFLSINEITEEKQKNYVSHFIREMNIADDCINIQQVKIPSYVYSYKKKDETNFFNTYSMFYHNKQCFKLIENYTRKNNISFDLVLKFRSDINYQEPIKFIDTIHSNTVYIPQGYNFGGINDQIAYGNMDSMSKYCDCIGELKSLCDETIFHPETILHKFLTKGNLHICRFSFAYKIK